MEREFLEDCVEPIFFLKSVGHQAHCPTWNSSKRIIEEKFLVYYISLKKVFLVALLAVAAEITDMALSI